MIERRHSIALRRSGFSLTEMLVALGIIVLLMSVLLPTAMRLRSVGKQTRCMNNLRQIGAMYLVYAERNNDCIPLGTSRFKDPDHPGVVPYTPYRPPPDGRPYPWPNYHPENNQYLWVEGSPSAAFGPFLLGKFINTDNAKMFYCPSEVVEYFRWEYNRPKFEEAIAGKPVNILTGYAVRPVRRLWTHDHIEHTVEYPAMPRLTRSDKVALAAEHPQRSVYNHGNEGDPIGHALYGDASVRVVRKKSIRPSLDAYQKYTGGFSSGDDANGSVSSRVDQPTVPSVWEAIDQN